MRRVHSIAGLLAAVIVSFMAITGAILSIQPLVEMTNAHAFGVGGSVAELASRVASSLPTVERITRSASGTVIAYFTSGSGAQDAAMIDPATGTVLGPVASSGFFGFITELHRSIFFGDAGRAVAGFASAGISILAASGIALLASRMGGWRRLFARVKGEGMQRLHTVLARIAVVGLVVTALSGLYMSLVYFGYVPDGSSLSFAMPPASNGGTPAAIDTLAALVNTPLSDLRELAYPAAGDVTDVFSITTSAGQGYIDQATGAMLDFTPNNFWQQLYETIYMLHTGAGMWWLGLLLGVAALAVPAMAVSGFVIWYQRRRQQIRIANNASWRNAETVILVGSEGNSTMSFAATLHEGLTEAGEKVHTATMNELRAYPKARRLLVLTATYGDGDAPSSAKHFLARLSKLKQSPAPAYAVLGFGDRSFQHYCAFADEVETALAATTAEPLLPYATIDRQSGQDFAVWGRALGNELGTPLDLQHKPVVPRTRRLVLVDRVDYGREVQAPTVVLRFKGEDQGWLGRFRRNSLPHFSVGDLVGIVPPGSVVPRYYSIASASSDGELEICVRKQTNGLCSEYLHALSPGDAIDAFIKPNPDFRPGTSRKPLILIGAGAGIAPLAGLVRHNRSHRPAYMFFGARDPQSDFLFREELEAALEDGRLTGLDTAFSRVVGGGYVQNHLLAAADQLRHLVNNGAQIVVCGGLDMAHGVRSAIDRVLEPVGLSYEHLKAQGRYIEDAY